MRSVLYFLVLATFCSNWSFLLTQSIHTSKFDCLQYAKVICKKLNQFLKQCGSWLSHLSSIRYNVMIESTYCPIVVIPVICKLFPHCIEHALSLMVPLSFILDFPHFEKWNGYCDWFTFIDVVYEMRARDNHGLGHGILKKLSFPVIWLPLTWGQTTSRESYVNILLVGWNQHNSYYWKSYNRIIKHFSDGGRKRDCVHLKIYFN